jgi:hypothetical protein
MLKAEAQEAGIPLAGNSIREGPSAMLRMRPGPTPEMRPTSAGEVAGPASRPVAHGAPGALGDLLPRTLGKKIQRALRVITSEAQELAREMKSGLAQYERELVISALETSRRHRSREPKATVQSLPDRLSRRIRRLQVTADGVEDMVGGLVEDLKRRLEAHAPAGRPGGEGSLDLKSQLEQYERELVVTALEACGMNQVLAARALGVLPTTLSEKMKRLGLRGPGRRTPRA